MFDSLKLHTSAIAGVGCVAIAFLFAAADAPVPAPASVDNDEQVSFANDVLPIFEQRCAECHGAPGDDGEPRLESGLNLLTYESTMLGSEFGTVIEAGDAEGSFLLEMIVEGDMPEEGDPVPAEEIETIRQWIMAGAPDN